MKKTIFLMAMMSAVALVSVSCRNGGDDKNEKSTETQIPIRKKILGKWYAKSITMVSGNPATPNDEPTYYDENNCEAQSYWDFGGDGKGVITRHNFINQNGKCVEAIGRAEYYLTAEKETEMKYKNLAEKFISKTNNQISLQASNTIKNQTNQQLYGLGRDSRYQQLISSYNM